jgi:tetratricopeptide (TPR) repeat protein
MHREANTHEPAEVAPAAAAEAEGLVGTADELLAEALATGSWPQAEIAERFLAEGKLDRALALYGRAMRLDPAEPAYPWNLALAINRLGLNDLALGFMAEIDFYSDEPAEFEAKLARGDDSTRLDRSRQIARHRSRPNRLIDSCR